MAVGLVLPSLFMFSLKILLCSVNCASLQQLCDTVFFQVTKCGLEEFVLITGADTGQGSVDIGIVDCVSRRKIPVVHYVITKRTSMEDISSVVRRHTVNQHLAHTTFVITTTCYDDVICSIKEYSQSDNRKRGLLWLHTTRWIFIATAPSSTVNVRTNILQRAPIDNVAFITFDTINSNSKDSITDLNVSVLLWAVNRTRELAEITVDDSRISNECILFPNLKNGLNGRHLTVITKNNWEFFVYVEKNSLTGKLEFKGFMIDVLHTLAEALNFTYTLTPDPNGPQASWDHIAYNVTEGQADLSATVWSYSWINVYNISVTYPVILDTFTGVYRRHQPSDEYISLYIICPFNSFTYVLLLASLVYSLIIYVIIVGLIYPHEKCETPRNPFTAKRISHFSSDRITKSKLFAENFFERLRKIAWAFGASILNQAYLPRPRQMSARLMLFFWSIAIVMFYAIYTGSLTAEMVNSSGANTLDSFNELVSGSNYHWGTTHDSIIDKVMKKSTGGLLYSLNQGKENIPDGVNGDIYDGLKQKIENLDDDFVVIHFKSLLDQIIGTTNNPGDFILMTDSLLSANQGFIVSKESELGHVFSEQIRKMHDAGMINKLYQNYAHGNRTLDVKCEEDRSRKSLTLHNIQWPLIIICLLVVVSLTVLLLERLWDPILGLRQTQGHGS